MRWVALIGSLGLALLPVTRTGQAQESGIQSVAGSYTFRTYCTTCHGEKGQGNGPLAEHLRFAPPDLTLLARRNGGEYPAEMVRRIIDGRTPVKGHGGPDMPVWGDAFKNAETGFDEEQVTARIEGLVRYLKTLQAE